MVRFYRPSHLVCGLWATIWSQSPLLVIGSFTKKKLRNAPEVLERLQEYLSIEPWLQTEADTLGYTLRWDGRSECFFPRRSPQQSRESHHATIRGNALE